jgi:hypothetical protein
MICTRGLFDCGMNYLDVTFDIIVTIDSIDFLLIMNNLD